MEFPSASRLHRGVSKVPQFVHDNRAVAVVGVLALLLLVLPMLVSSVLIVSFNADGTSDAELSAFASASWGDWATDTDGSSCLSVLELNCCCIWEITDNTGLCKLIRGSITTGGIFFKGSPLLPVGASRLITRIGKRR